MMQKKKKKLYALMFAGSAGALDEAVTLTRGCSAAPLARDRRYACLYRTRSKAARREQTDGLG
jgi:hypothetical protein